MGDEKWLRQAAEEIRNEGHYGWGNTCEQAADRIAELEAQELGWITTLCTMELEARKLRESNDSLRITVAKLEGLLFTSKGEQHEP